MGKSTISMAILPEGIHITNITTLRPTIWNFTHSIPTVYIPRCSSIFSRDPQSFFQLRGLHGVEPAVVSGTSKTDENCAWHGGASGASGQICDDLLETNQKTQRIPNFSILFFPPTWPHPLTVQNRGAHHQNAIAAMSEVDLNCAMDLWSGSTPQMESMWVKQCHKPPIREWFIHLYNCLYHL